MKIKLNTGHFIPKIGLGTYNLPNEMAEELVKDAIANGYRQFDTAYYYKNEQGVGKGINNAPIPREEIFLTTKIWPTQYRDSNNAIAEALGKLQTYVDLFLLHWPGDNKEEQTRAYSSLIKNSKIKSVGVSNFGIDLIEDLIKETDVIPAVNQIKFNPWSKQEELVDYCHHKGIVIQAHTPLNKGGIALENAELIKIAKNNNCSPAQLLIKWAVAKNTIPIPKSSRGLRLEENFKSLGLDINQEDLEKLDFFS